jgi:kinesin family protein 11
MGTIQPASDPARGLKLSEARYNRDVSHGETNINVVVRCRGRNEREVRENTPVVVSTNGVKGTTVELAMGPRAPGDLTFSFDKVFSPAADQAMIFNEVAAPILEEVCHVCSEMF